MTQNNIITTSQGGVTGKGFQPGQSGNPGGRPRGLASKVREVTKDGADPILFLMDVLEGKVTGTRVKDRIEASKILLDRGFGKATTVIEAEVNHGKQNSSDNESVYLSEKQAVGMLKLIDELGIDGIAKLAKHLDQGEIIEGAYTDVGDGV